MKLARFTVNGVTRSGAVLGDQVIDIAELDPTAPQTIRELLAAGPAGRQRIAQALRNPPAGHALSAVKLEAPIPDAQKYLAIGMNYQDHADEAAKGYCDPQEPALVQQAGELHHRPL